MGACHARPVAVVPELAPTDKQFHDALLSYHSLHQQIKQQDSPFLLTLTFINEMNATRALLQGLLRGLEVDYASNAAHYEAYFEAKDQAIKECLQKRFRDGRIRVTGSTMRVPGVMELLMPTEKGRRGGSALF